MTFFKFLLCLLSFTSIWAAPRGDPNAPHQIFALLVAGSNGIYNYRHQADIGHSYHLLLNKGIPASNIITLMYDDVVNDPQNPNPGKLLNEPNGPDYYPGLKIDYRANDVNRDIFHAVLTGNKSAVQGHGTERVIESTSQDNIFVYYGDHGASGLVAMPTGPVVTSTDLHNWVHEAKAKNMYNQIAIYIEACESGSMLMDWSDLGFVGLTASNPYESSWATYCDGPICYADEFSITWMRNSEAHDLSIFELEQQYEKVHDGVKKSTVMQYGQTTLESERVGFQGESGKQTFTNKNNQDKYQKVSSRDVPIYFLESKLRQAKNEQETQVHLQELHELYKIRSMARQWFGQLIEWLSLNFSTLEEANDLKQKELNYDALIKEFESSCFQLGQNTYLLEFVVQFRQFASKNVDKNELRFAIRSFCLSTQHNLHGVTIV